jgi:hypothetical protein
LKKKVWSVIKSWYIIKFQVCFKNFPPSFKLKWLLWLMYIIDWWIMYAGEKQFAQKVEIKICNVFFKVRSLNLRPFSFQELLGGKNAIMSQSNSYNFLSSWLVSMCSVIINLSIYCILKLSSSSHAFVLHFRHSNSFWRFDQHSWSMNSPPRCCTFLAIV